MSSYELLELLEFMPERGAFKTAARGGEYSGDEKVWVQIANEIAILRAAYVPKAEGEKWGSQIHLSPLKIKELLEKDAAQTEVRESFYAFATKEGVAERNTPEVGDDDDDDDFGDWR